MVKTDLHKEIKKMDFFRKKKKEEKAPEEEVKKPKTQLETLCEGNSELYETLTLTLRLDPKRISTSWKELMKKAEKEKKGGNLQLSWNSFIEAIQISLWMEGEKELKRATEKALEKDFEEFHQRRYVERSGNLKTFLQDPRETIRISREYYIEKKEEYREKKEKEEE
jgi:hypothetical protein